LRWLVVGDRALVMALFGTAGTLFVCGIAASPLWLRY